MIMSSRRCAAVCFALSTLWCSAAHAWGDEGHEVIALIARSYLTPTARKTVDAMLAADDDSLTAHDIASAATWADKLRDKDRDGARKNTRLWHFVDIELTAPDLDRACYGHPSVPIATVASNGPVQDCVVDKIDEFAAELANPATDASERIVALKFLLHLVGDLHQPLHSADDHDRGGNDKRASAAGSRAGTLHHYWDTAFVTRLGSDPKQIAAALIGRISPAASRDWARGTPSEWAIESFQLARADVYGRLPMPNSRGSYRLSDDYVVMALRDVSVQLEKAGVRLAFMLNKALPQR